METGFLIRRLNNSVRRYYGRLFSRKAVGECTLSTLWTLDFLFHNQAKEINQKDIEMCCGINRASASRLLKLLEEKHLISRSTSETDNRRKVIRLEAEGFAIQELSDAVRAEVEAEISQALTEEELSVFRDLCTKIINHMEGAMHENDKNSTEINT